MRADEYLAGRAVHADPVAFLEGEAAVGRSGALRAVIDDELGAAGDARLADLAGDHGGVGRRAAAGGQDPLGDRHSVKVVGRGLDADEDDLLAAADPLDRHVGVEDRLADGRAGRRVEALGDPLGLLARAGVELGPQELVDLGGFDPADRLLLRDRAVLDHVDRDLHRGCRGPLGGARLEHVELAALDRELEVLDVAVVALELLPDLLELVVDRRHLLGHLGDLREPSGRRPRRPRPGRW